MQPARSCPLTQAHRPAPPPLPGRSDWAPRGPGRGGGAPRDAAQGGVRSARGRVPRGLLRPVWLPRGHGRARRAGGPAGRAAAGHHLHAQAHACGRRAGARPRLRHARAAQAMLPPRARGAAPAEGPLWPAAWAALGFMMPRGGRARAPPESDQAAGRRRPWLCLFACARTHSMGAQVHETRSACSLRSAAAHHACTALGTAACQSAWS